MIIKDLEFQFSADNRFKLIIDQLNFEQGSLNCFVGANGSGKTTLGKIITGLIKPDRGAVVLANEMITGLPAHVISEKIGYTFQNPNNQLFTRSVEEEIVHGAGSLSLTGQAASTRLTDLLEKYGLKKYRLFHPKRLSRGEKQKVILSSVLFKDPSILILDEPFSGIDQKQTVLLMDQLKELKSRGKIILLITHKLDIVMEYSDSMVGLKDGKLAFHHHRNHYPGCFSQVEDVLGLKLPPGPSLMVSLAKEGMNNHIKCISDLISS